MKPRPNPLAGRRHAFTLVELLVVIGIISLLIAILLPSLGRAREMSRQVVCLSQLRQIGMAMMMHAHEHRGYMQVVGGIASPFNSTPEGMVDSSRVRYSYYFDETTSPKSFRLMNLAGATAPYLGQRIRSDSRANMLADLADGSAAKTFICPSDDMKWSGFTAKVQGQWTGPIMTMSYGFNEAVLGIRDASPTGNDFDERRGLLSRLKDSSRVFILCDALPRNNFNNGWLTFYAAKAGATMEDAFFNYNGRAGDASMFLPFRHAGRINFLFADAHGEMLTLPRPGTQYSPTGPLSQVLIMPHP